MSRPEFVKRSVGTVANDVPPGAMNTFSAVGDVNCDGMPDVVISGRSGRMVWLENRGERGEWVAHLVDQVDGVECGGSLHDLNGNGYPDIINGGDWRSDEICWWENPAATGGRWARRLIARTGHGQFHDTAIGDVTGDGRLSLVFTNQGQGTTLYRIPLPEDPTRSPWPGIESIAERLVEPNPYRPEGVQPEEGLAIGDLDGDGRNELVCGTHWFRYTGREWEKHKFAAGYITTKVAIGDVDGDGRNEIVLAEGDPCIYGKRQGGSLAWFKPGPDLHGLWEEHVLETSLLDAHSLQLGDICGHGRRDILAGEVGVADPATDAYVGRLPRLLVLENEGHGAFTRHVIDEGTGTHDAVLADMRRRGVLDIVGKPLHGAEKWHVHVWYSQRGAERNGR